LQRFLDHKPIQARPVGVWERAVKWVRREPARAGMVASFAAAALVLIAGGIWSYFALRAAYEKEKRSSQQAHRAADDLYVEMAEQWLDEPHVAPPQRKFLEKALRWYKEFTQQQQDDPQARKDCAKAHFRIGQIHAKLRQDAAAQAAYAEAIALQQQLQREFPDDPACRRDLANSYNWLGELFREGGRRLPEAEQAYRQALALQTQLVAAFPTNPAYRQERARSHYNLGIVQMDTNRLDAARADYDQAILLLRQLQEEYPQEAEYQHDLARSYINRGILHKATRQPRPAESDYRQAIALTTRLQAQPGARPVYQHDLAVTTNNLGNLFAGEGRVAEALNAHRQALTMSKELVGKFYGRPSYRKELANTHNSLGAVLAQQAQLAEAEQHWLDAQRLLRALVTEFDAVADYHGHLGLTLGNLGWLAASQRRHHEARDRLEESIRHLRRALRDNGDHPVYLHALRSQYQSLAETAIELGDHPAAAAAARRLVEFGRKADPIWSYYAACFLARCAPLAAPASDGVDEGRTPQSQRYADEALAFLQEAVQRGFADAARLRADQASIFQPLAERDAFRRLLRDLEARESPKQ
jgi:tetratricopeptide (TPR) repeat protein